MHPGAWAQVVPPLAPTGAATGVSALEYEGDSALENEEDGYSDSEDDAEEEEEA
jgi:hypothetical protein